MERAQSSSELELVRTDEFAAADVLTVSGLPVPATNQVTELNQGHRLAGQPLRLHSLLGTEAVLPGHPNPLKRGYLTLQVEAKGTAVGQRVTLMTVTDEQGRLVKIDGQPSRSGTKLNYLLKAGPDTRALTLRFVRQESRIVSFVAHPTRVGSNTGR